MIYSSAFNERKKPRDREMHTPLRSRTHTRAQTKNNGSHEPMVKLVICIFSERENPIFGWISKRKPNQLAATHADTRCWLGSLNLSIYFTTSVISWTAIRAFAAITGDSYWKSGLTTDKIHMISVHWIVDFSFLSIKVEPSWPINELLSSVLHLFLIAY